MHGFLWRHFWIATFVVLATLIASAAVLIHALGAQAARRDYIIAFHRLAAETDRLEEALLRLPLLGQEGREEARSAFLALLSEYRAVSQVDGIDSIFGGPGTGGGADHLDDLAREFGLSGPPADVASLRAMPSALRDVWEWGRGMEAGHMPLERSLARLLREAAPLVRASGDLEVGELARIRALAELATGEIRPAIERVSAILTEELAASGRRTVWAIILLSLLGMAAALGNALFVFRPLGRAVMANEARLVAERDRALAAEEAKRNFLSVVSHELRTPMNGILGFASLLLNADLRPEHRKQVEIIHASGKAMLRLVNDILDLAKLDAGALRLEDEDFALAEVVTGVMALLRASASAKGLEMGLYIDPALPGKMRGDANRLRQILTNLVGNAIKFTEHGSVGVEVHYRSPAGDDAAGWVEIAVRDTGVGIPGDKLEAVFERFTQVDDSARRKFEGTGLGLAICRELVERMGGAISVTSRPGEGSVFTVRLPWRGARDRAVEEGGGVATPSISGRLLVVDDNGVNRRLCRLQLEAAGAEVLEAEGGEAALERLEEAAAAHAMPQAAVIDHMMPGMDGPALARRLRQDLRFAGMRLVLASSGLRGAGSQGLEGLFDAIIEKPVLPDALLSALAGREGGREEPPARPAPRILVVEDEETGRRLVQEILRQFRCETEEAHDGFEALRRAASGHFDVLLMDLRMPAMDGIETTERLRRVGSPGAQVPVVLVTAGALGEAERRRCREAGIAQVLEKPLEAGALAAALAEALGHPLDRVATERDARGLGRGLRRSDAPHLRVLGH